MSVTYKPIDGELVSKEWLAVLLAMRADGVYFRVNEGHRTMARQQYFWDLYRSGRGNLAAYPSANAPHIRTGRIDHAIDFSNDASVMRWMAANHLPARRTVNGESWHIEIPAANLRASYGVHHARDPVIRKGTKNKKAILTLQHLLRGLHYSKVISGHYGIWTRRAVRRFQKNHHLPVDGVVGAATWRALKAASK